MFLKFGLIALDQKVRQKRDQNRNKKRIYGNQRMFKALFYPREVQFYTDNVHASVTNSMSVLKCPILDINLPDIPSVANECIFYLSNFQLGWSESDTSGLNSFFIKTVYSIFVKN